jgi:hypothetical protein
MVEISAHAKVKPGGLHGQSRHIFVEMRHEFRIQAVNQAGPSVMDSAGSGCGPLEARVPNIEGMRGALYSRRNDCGVFPHQSLNALVKASGEE